MDKITQNIAIHLPEDQSVFTFQSADLSHISIATLGQNHAGLIRKGKGPHHPGYSYDIIKIHSLMINSEFKEYNRESDSKTP